MTQIPDKLRPWFPVNWSENLSAVYALKALNVGEATPDQQKLALDFIVYVVSKRNEIPYYPDSDRDSAFATGRLFVGEQILKMLALKGDEIEKAKSPPILPPRRR